VTLFWKVFLVNAALVTVATLALAASPATVSSPLLLTEAVVLCAGVAVMVIADWLLLRRAFAPFEELKRLMARVDPLMPGARVEVHPSHAEFEELARAFNEMMERLEAERRDSARRASAAEEGERRRLSGELHDEIGQRLGALLLALQGLERAAPPALQQRIEELREEMRAALDEVRAIARRLRPEALDELGLSSALAALTASIGRAGVHVRRHIEPDLPALSQDEELVVYRVAQEALANVTRHAHAGEASLELGRRNGIVQLVIADPGAGFDAGRAPAGRAPAGQGIRAMRERALTIGARLDITSAPGAGTSVRLTLPPS
jgi:two-component system sensor histidine kinase UhpB